MNVTIVESTTLATVAYDDFNQGIRGRFPYKRVSDGGAVPPDATIRPGAREGRNI